MASAIRLRAQALRLTNQTVAAATRRRQFSSTPARHAADVKSLGVIGAGQMVSSYLGSIYKRQFAENLPTHFTPGPRYRVGGSTEGECAGYARRLVTSRPGQGIGVCRLVNPYE